MPAAVREWGETLYGLGSNEIREGLEKLGDWMPSAPEFRRLCRPDSSWQHRSEAYKPVDISHRISGKMADKDQVLGDLRNMIEQLKK